jgi:putative component of toxin-antitoxin plasmid stabilization module
LTYTNRGIESTAKVPKTQVVFYQEADGRAPVREWLTELRRSDAKAHAKCAARIDRLSEAGHELRRPEADHLRDGIYELRAKKGHVNYRILYFFHGRIAAVLAHALTKEDAVPSADIQRALARKALFEHDPAKHTSQENSP